MKYFQFDRRINLTIIVLGVIFSFIYVSPWVLKGEDAFVRIHDSLDSLNGWHTVMAREGIWFAPNDAQVVPMHVGGAPRVSLPTEISLTPLLFVLFDPYWAYIAQQFIIRMLAFSGIALVVLEIVPRTHPIRFSVAVAAGMAFAAVPFWAWTGSAAGVGWVAYAVLRLWRGKAPTLSYLVLALYPLISSLMLTGMYIVGLMWVLAALAIWKSPRPLRHFYAALITTVGHIVAEYRLFLFLINPGFVPHRAEFVIGHYDLNAATAAFVNDFMGMASGVPSLQYPLVFILALAVCLLGLAIWVGGLAGPRAATVQWLRLDSAERTLIVLLGASLAASATFSFMTAFWEWTGTQLVRDHVPLLNMVSLQRGIFFHPFLWSFAFAICLALLTARAKRVAGMALVAVLTAGQMFVAARSHEYRTERKQSGITYRQFIATALFESIVRELSIDRSRAVAVAIGIHPSVLQANGFWTADAYLALYPLAYKHRFRELVYPEFARNKDVLSYFDDWGSRAYVFSAEMTCPRFGAVCKADDGARIERLAVHSDAFAAFGIDYIFSGTIIGNAAEIGLADLGTFRHPDSAWAITVYSTRGYAPTPPRP